MGNKKHSLAGISSRNKKEKLPSKPILSSSTKPESDSAVLVKAGIKFADPYAAAFKLESNSESEPEPVEREIEMEYRNTLPKVEVMAISEDVKKAFYSIMNLFDTFYFNVFNKGNICSKKVERGCLSSCQHYAWCIKKAETKNIIKII